MAFIGVRISWDILARNPENHADLMVRVAGFSAYFVHLTKEIQDEVIGRTTHSI